MRAKLVAAVVTGALALGGSAPASATPIEIGHVPKCLELVPAAISLDHVPSTLEVRVLLDGVSGKRGRAVFEEVQRSYRTQRITLEPSFQPVDFSGTDVEELVEHAKSLFGGARPAGADIVYTLTGKDLTALGDTAVAGFADCIGGVAFEDRAFAIGESFDSDSGDILGLPQLRNRGLTAKVAAHEIGHLMGAHHHYANCVEGLLREGLSPNFSPCTLMFNDIGLAAYGYSSVNSLVVRGHAEAYSQP